MTPAFAQKIAVRVGKAERDFQIKTGVPLRDAYARGYATADETYELAMAPERELITLGLRSITHAV